MDPYLMEGTIRDRATKKPHRVELYWDVFFMDHIWAARETWSERLESIEMTVFQNVLIKRGLKEHPDEEDEMLARVQFLLVYAVVLAGECLHWGQRGSYLAGTVRIY